MNKFVAESLRVRRSSQRAAIAAVGVATLALFSVSATAGTSVAYVPSKRVDFEDLDLSKQSDARRLYARLRLAASEVCMGYPDARRPSPRTARGRCINEAIADAVEAIDHPNLTALHAASREVRLAQAKAKASAHT
jgi:UrcA family protein